MLQLHLALSLASTLAAAFSGGMWICFKELEEVKHLSVQLILHPSAERCKHLQTSADPDVSQSDRPSFSAPDPFYRRPRSCDSNMVYSHVTSSSAEKVTGRSPNRRWQESNEHSLTRGQRSVRARETPIIISSNFFWFSLVDGISVTQLIGRPLTPYWGFEEQ